jgi:cytochrome c5
MKLRKRPFRRLGACAAIAAAAATFIAAGCSGVPHDAVDRSKMPPDVRTAYDVFTRKCSKCHSLARPLSAGITDDDEWARYVSRMRRQPGSGITVDDQEVILQFLRYYAAEQRLKANKSGGAP